MTARIPPVLRPEHPLARPLAGLIAEFGLESIGVIDGVEITGVTLRSTEVQPGDLFVGVDGVASHGASYAAEAAGSGAVALLTDAAGAEIAAGSGLPIVVVESPRTALGDISAWVYRTNEHPPLLLGVTGTNGKTSTAYLVEAILKQLGLVTGLSSTAERHIGDLNVVSRLTTPEASEMHALLARMRESEVRAVAIEVSAQALSRNRVDGLFFDVVAFTNLSHDHLDDYRDMDEYFAAKVAFFEPDRGRRGVVSLDSPWGEKVVERSRVPVTTVSATPSVPGEWNVETLEETAAHTRFRLTGPEGRSLETSVPLIGWHMAANAGLAIVMLVEAGFELEAIGQAIQGGIDAYLPGRTERVSGARGPSVYVDFGHSPDAFLNTLGAVRNVTRGRVIMLFGADGDRDKTKRSEMGRVASENSDILVITDHHPRFEDPDSIRAMLVAGAKLAEHQAELFEISPPEEAIRTAVSVAREGDSILWAGPGHQDYRDIRGVRTQYSARQLARDALRDAGWDAPVVDRPGADPPVIALSLAEIASALDGTLYPSDEADLVISGSVETDSRLVTPGSIFFALKGENTDGSLFAASAVDNGAAVLVVSEPLALPVAQVIVADPLDALASLARYVVARVRAIGRLQVVGITGSNGKTTTKNMLRVILSAQGPTVAPQGSYNNQVGAPYTMLLIDEQTRFLVVEMGASAVGDIARTIGIVVPDISVVLKVGMAHAGEFGGIEQTQKAKSEIVTSLPATATAVLNRDDHRVVAMAAMTAARPVWFGLDAEADIRAEGLRATSAGTVFTVVAGLQSRQVTLRVLGEHHVMNALAAITVALELGVQLDDAVAALSTIERAERWRMEVLHPGGDITIINDAYNASPDSTAAALKTLAQIVEPEQRSVAVLGEMNALGEYADDEHDRIGRLVVRLNIQKLVVVGHRARHIHNAAALEGSWDGESVLVETDDEAYDLLSDELRAGDVVLVKSSNAAGLRHLGDRLGRVQP